jgi:D-alanyl-D-alanine carboxypeptidase/D-alanyl-D-alanine-endopeptidase (penicillin-binding protein 4)
MSVGEREAPDEVLKMWMTNRQRRAGISLGVLGLLLASAVSAETPLTARIDAALQRLGPHTLAAVRVVSPSRGQVLYERNVDLSMNPASNMKLFTSAAAMAKLGPDFRFTTRVLAAAKPNADGVVAGDLILQGGGDPVLETPHLEKLAEALKAQGVKRVTGGLVADDYRYDDERLGVAWNSDDEPFYYSAQITALTVNRNVLLVSVSPGREGAPAQIDVKPLAGYVTVENRVTTGAAGSRTAVRISRRRARNEVVVSGTIAAGGDPVTDREVTMEEPELYAAGLFKKLLAERGIVVVGDIRREKAPKEPVELAAHHSVPLAEILPLLNKPSDNLIAELLLKEIGYTCKQSGDADTGSTVVEGWLKEIGVQTGGVRVNDGSGLSRMDLVTSRSVSELLLWVDRQPWREVFVKSLPLAGVDGTLRRRMKGTLAEKNVAAKTGSLGHVTALGGYVTTRSGERLVFSVLINNFPGSVASGAKPVEDAIAVALAEEGMSAAAGR